MRDEPSQFNGWNFYHPGDPAGKNWQKCLWVPYTLRSVTIWILAVGAGRPEEPIAIECWQTTSKSHLNRVLMGSIQFSQKCSKLVSIERSCFFMAITPRAALLVHASSRNRRKSGSKSLVYRDFRLSFQWAIFDQSQNESKVVSIEGGINFTGRTHILRSKSYWLKEYDHFKHPTWTHGWRHPLKICIFRGSFLPNYGRKKVVSCFSHNFGLLFQMRPFSTKSVKT